MREYLHSGGLLRAIGLRRRFQEAVGGNHTKLLPERGEAISSRAHPDAVDVDGLPVTADGLGVGHHVGLVDALELLLLSLETETTGDSGTGLYAGPPATTGKPATARVAPTFPGETCRSGATRGGGSYLLPR